MLYRDICKFLYKTSTVRCERYGCHDFLLPWKLQWVISEYRLKVNPSLCAPFFLAPILLSRTSVLCKLISDLLKYSKWMWGWNMKEEPFWVKITRGGGGGDDIGVSKHSPLLLWRDATQKIALKITYSWVNTCFASKDTFTKIVGNFHCLSVTISIISLFLLFLAWGSIIVRPQCSDHWKTAWKENDCTEKSNVWPGAVLHHNQYPNVYPCYSVFLFILL